MQRTIAVDLSKSVFQVAISVSPGKVADSKRLSRSRFERFILNEPPSHFLLEACGSAHYWGRRILSHGHTVSLLPPHHSRKYRTANKTDRSDTKALLEAARNEEIHAVPVKSEDQQCLTGLHRLRQGYIKTRTRRMNAARGLLREYGYAIPEGTKKLKEALHEDALAEVPAPLRRMLLEVRLEIDELERCIALVETKLEGLCETSPMVDRLRTIPGVGLITATALVAQIGDARRFPTARHFASYLGLTPKEHSSGLKRRLGSISKQGDTYLRTMLVHGGRVVVRWSKTKEGTSPLYDWAQERVRRSGYNKAAVAVANKLARYVWAVWTQDRDFRQTA